MIVNACVLQQMAHRIPCPRHANKKNKECNENKMTNIASEVLDPIRNAVDNRSQHTICPDLEKDLRIVEMSSSIDL